MMKSLSSCNKLAAWPRCHHHCHPRVNLLFWKGFSHKLLTLFFFLSESKRRCCTREKQGDNKSPIFVGRDFGQWAVFLLIARCVYSPAPSCLTPCLTKNRECPSSICPLLLPSCTTAKKGAAPLLDYRRVHRKSAQIRAPAVDNNRAVTKKT